MFVTMVVWKGIKHWAAVNQQWFTAQFLVESHEDMGLIGIDGL